MASPCSQGEQVRRAVARYPVSVNWESHALEGEIVDVSTEGMGIELNTRIERGSGVKFEIGVAGGRICSSATVMYCRVIRDGKYRIGLHLSELGRIERVLWQKFAA
jgi:hypothetical protein